MKNRIKVLLMAMAIGGGSMYAQEKMEKDSVKHNKMHHNKEMAHMMDKKSKDGKMHNMEMGHMMNDSMKTMHNEMSMKMANIKDWPEASQKAVEEITKKYGEPSGITSSELIWNDAGVWKTIRISKEETKHNFPIEHTDMMQMTIMHEVPEDKMDELGAFDGSVTFDRTQGFLSARCDLEANNLLALNLAHDIITDKKTVEEARKAYANAIKEMMNGGKPEYQQKLTFSTEKDAADPDQNTTGLTKKEVMAKMKTATASNK